MLALIATIPDSREANIDRINMTTNHIDIHAILQSPKQFCDLETFISVAELARDNEAEIATLRAQVAAGDALRGAMVKLAGTIKNRAFALNKSGDDDFEMLGAHYSGLADEITKAIDASKKVKP